MGTFPGERPPRPAYAALTAGAARNARKAALDRPDLRPASPPQHRVRGGVLRGARTTQGRQGCRHLFLPGRGRLSPAQEPRKRRFRSDTRLWAQPFRCLKKMGADPCAGATKDGRILHLSLRGAAEKKFSLCCTKTCNFSLHSRRECRDLAEGGAALWSFVAVRPPPGPGAPERPSGDGPRGAGPQKRMRCTAGGSVQCTARGASAGGKRGGRGAN